MGKTVGHSRGSELLRQWRGERQQKVVSEMLGLDSVSYSRFENGVRKPAAEVMVRIAKKTGNEVPAAAWFNPPRGVSIRRAS